MTSAGACRSEGSSILRAGEGLQRATKQMVKAAGSFFSVSTSELCGISWA